MVCYNEECGGEWSRQRIKPKSNLLDASSTLATSTTHLHTTQLTREDSLRVLIILIVAMAVLLLVSPAFGLQATGSYQYGVHTLYGVGDWHMNTSTQGHISQIRATFIDGYNANVKMRIVRYSAFTPIEYTNLTTRYVNGPAYTAWNPNYTFVCNMNTGMYSAVQVSWGGMTYWATLFFVHN